jgi:hypothetical protein
MDLSRQVYQFPSDGNAIGTEPKGSWDQRF